MKLKVNRKYHEKCAIIIRTLYSFYTSLPDSFVKYTQSFVAGCLYVTANEVTYCSSLSDVYRPAQSMPVTRLIPPKEICTYLLSNVS